MFQIQPASFDRPLQELREYSASKPVLVPDLFLDHRKHHGAPVSLAETWQIDREALDHLPGLNQKGVFVHVLTRFAFGMRTALFVLPALEQAAKAGGRERCEHYKALAEDTLFIAEECERYVNQAAQIQSDPDAYTPTFRHIFTEIFPRRHHELVRAIESGSRKDQVEAEARLRVVYHIIGEGLGAITGIWGINSALRELRHGNSMRQGGIELPGLAGLTAQLTLIQRRHIAFGLSELGELAKERYFSTAKAVIGEFISTKPLLEKMRGETFARWGEDSFPFAINKDELAAAGKKRVIGWIGSHILKRPSIRERQRLTTLADIV